MTETPTAQDHMLNDLDKRIKEAVALTEDTLSKASPGKYQSYYEYVQPKYVQEVVKSSALPHNIVYHQPEPILYHQPEPILYHQQEPIVYHQQEPIVYHQPEQDIYHHYTYDPNVNYHTRKNILFRIFLKISFKLLIIKFQ